MKPHVNKEDPVRVSEQIFASELNKLHGEGLGYSEPCFMAKMTWHSGFQPVFPMTMLGNYEPEERFV